jgi:hypothetical protein
VFIYFLGVLVYTYPILRFRVLLVLRGLSYPYGPVNILRVLFYILVLFVAL